MTIKKSAPTLVCALFLSACATDEVNQLGGENGERVIDGSGSSVEGQGYQNQGATLGQVKINQQGTTGYHQANLSAAEKLMQSYEFSDPSSPLSTRTIYFEYDSSRVLDKFTPIIEAHAQYLMRHPGQRIVLEGHSDERGTREYNISLGEQRAKSIFKMMQLLGVMSHQIELVSYGEEKPIAYEHNAAAFKLNRRVEMEYK